jgi:hypothetical protein
MRTIRTGGSVSPSLTPLAEGASAVETMKHKLKTKAGRAAYALRKQTVEPVFGIIKSVMGFRQFLLRGLDNVPERMDAGLPGVEFETHGRIASAVRKRTGNRALSRRNRAENDLQARFAFRIANTTPPWVA